MEWKLQRAEHNEMMILARIDGLVGSNALYVLAYTGLLTQFKGGGAALYILYAFPIIMMVLAAFTLYSGVMDASLAFGMRRQVAQSIEDPEVRFLLNPRWIPLYTTFIRSMLFPFLTILLWSFLMIGFGAGEVYSVLPPVIACCAIAAALAICVAAWIMRSV